jgi:hypothetical protein
VAKSGIKYNGRATNSFFSFLQIGMALGAFSVHFNHKSKAEGGGDEMNRNTFMFAVNEHSGLEMQLNRNLIGRELLIQLMECKF